MEHGAGRPLAHEHDEAAEVDGDPHRGEPHDDVPETGKEKVIKGDKERKKREMRKLWDNDIQSGFLGIGSSQRSGCGWFC